MRTKEAKLETVVLLDEVVGVLEVVFVYVLGGHKK
jgi:hypothetical protein